MKQNLKYLILILLVTFLFLSITVGCEKINLNKMPKVKTKPVSEIMSTSAVASGDIVDLGEGVTDYGHCWSTLKNPTISDSVTSFGNCIKTGTFISNLLYLEPDKTYHVRAYLISKDEAVYGSDTCFTTTNGLATLTTLDVLNITITSAMCGGNVLTVNGDSVLSRGICWDTLTSVSILNNIGSIQNGSGLGQFSCTLTKLIPGKIYYVKAWATTNIGTTYGDLKIFTTLSGVVDINTTEISSITPNTAISGGTITDDGGASILTRGVCWSTLQNPTVENNKTIDGSGIGSFTSNITGLQLGQRYFVRAYAKNSVCTTYGQQVSFIANSTVTDIDGNIYNTITIGTQLWMIENLKVTKFNEGSVIQIVTNNSSWAALSTPAYCWYNYNEVFYRNTYGALYNWYAVNTGLLCPSGWHVPSYDDLMMLITYLGGESIAGGKLKETGTTYWLSPNEGATNETNFTALPGGFNSKDGGFSLVGDSGKWWVTSDYSTSSAWYCIMSYSNSNVYISYANYRNGFSVRCLKD